MKKTEKTYDLIIIGAGASGCMAGITAAREGRNVLILDHSKIPAKKILATGNGKCNFTNIMQGSSCYRSDAPAFVVHILEYFSEHDTLNFFESLGVPYREKNGYCYPRNGQASAIREALLAELHRLEVPIFSEISIETLTFENGFFHVLTNREIFRANTCLIATGGKASPKTGSDGSGYSFAQHFGHTLIDPVPALTPLIADKSWPKGWSGVRTEATVSVLINHKPICQDTGEVQFTDYGISGIPVFQVSRFAASALSGQENVFAVIDFLPEWSFAETRQRLDSYADHGASSRNWYHVLSGVLNSKVASVILNVCSLPEEAICMLGEKKYRKTMDIVCRKLKEYRIPITAVKGFEQAQVTCGGIPLSEIRQDTMESALQPGLYFAGEILNVDGICGGYNLQWAWSSGFVAGRAAAHFGE